MHQLDESKIKKVWDIFKELASIPRGSGNEKQVSDWIVNYCDSNGLKAIQDKHHNIIIKKPASPGYEDYSPIILQGHMDMVNEKTLDSDHDFTKDPLKLMVKDGFLTADGTTLGADNGIGIALILAFLTDDTRQHPALEALFTTEEETTMNGAKNVDYSKLKGRHLISFDHCKEGEMCTGCAGIVKLGITGRFKEETAPKDFTCIDLTLSGLKGGHSGNDIVLRHSAFGFLARALHALMGKFDVRVGDIECGSKPNAIARDFRAKVWVDAKDVKDLPQQLQTDFNAEILRDDEALTLKSNPVHKAMGKCLTRDESARLINLLMLMPNGMQTMLEPPDLAESSLNTGFAMLSGGRLDFGITVRSSVKSLETLIVGKLESLSRTFKLDMDIEEVSPMFSSFGSPLATFCAATYERLYGTPMASRRVHAIVEAGVFQKNLPGIEIMLLAPDLFDIHSPLERLDIKSTERTWDLFTELMAAAKF